MVPSLETASGKLRANSFTLTKYRIEIQRLAPAGGRRRHLEFQSTSSTLGPLLGADVNMSGIPPGTPPGMPPGIPPISSMSMSWTLDDGGGGGGGAGIPADVGIGAAHDAGAMLRELGWAREGDGSTGA